MGYSVRGMRREDKNIVMYRLAHEIKSGGFTPSVTLILSLHTFTSLITDIQDPCVKSMQHLTRCVRSRYAASRGKDSRRPSMIILVYLHTQNAHFCRGVGGSRLP